MQNKQDLTQEIMKAIQIAGVNGVLTTEAVDYVKNVLSENKKIYDDNTILKKKLDESLIKYKEIMDKCNHLSERINSFSSREEEISEREKNMIKLECENDFQKQRVNDHINMVSLIFRNLETRRNVFTPVEGGSQYDGRQSQGFVQRDEQYETVK